MLNPELQETLDYTQLNEIQNNILDRGTTYIPSKGMPFFIEHTTFILKLLNCLIKKYLFIEIR